jgi:two-component sensor histidine kinase
VRGVLRTVRARLAALLLIGAIPVLAVGVGGAMMRYREARQNVLADATLLMEAVATRHEAAVDGAGQLLLALSRVPALTTGTPEACDMVLADLLRLQSGRYSNFGVHDADGLRRCTALPAPRGQPLVNMDPFNRARAAGRLVIGPLVYGDQSRMPVLVAAVPITMADGRTGVLLTGILQAHLARETRSVLPSGGGWVWLLPPQGDAVSPDGASPDRLPPAAIINDLRSVDRTTVLADDRAGRPTAYAARRLEDGFHLLVAMPAERGLAAARDAAVARAAELAILLFVALGAIMIGGNVAVVRPLGRLREAMRGWRGGGTFAMPDLTAAPVEVQETADAFGAAVATLAQREQELRHALEQRDLLMTEIHHRVKNNLQVVASLLNLQSGRVRQAEARAEFTSARDRVRALATLHRHLYVGGQFDRVRLADFITEMVEQLFQAFGETPNDRIRLHVDVADVTLTADQAVPLALIVTESVTNALKYAFPDGRSGTIEVKAREVDGRRLFVIVADDGTGPTRPDPARGDGLGARLMDAFAKQLGARLTTVVDAGTVVTIELPLLVGGSAPAASAGPEPVPAAMPRPDHTPSLAITPGR